jgi:hypothetical protein
MSELALMYQILRSERRIRGRSSRTTSRFSHCTDGTALPIRMALASERTLRKPDQNGRKARDLVTGQTARALERGWEPGRSPLSGGRLHDEASLLFLNRFQQRALACWIGLSTPGTNRPHAVILERIAEVVLHVSPFERKLF